MDFVRKKLLKAWAFRSQEGGVRSARERHPLLNSGAGSSFLREHVQLRFTYVNAGAASHGAASHGIGS